MVNDMEDETLKAIANTLNQINKLGEAIVQLEKVNEQLERIGDILEDHWNCVSKRRKYFEKTPHF